MAQNAPGRSYRQLEQMLTIAVIADTAIFLLYLLFAGLGITWLKVILALAGMVLSVLGVVFLFLVNEHKRRRSLWILCAFGSIAACILVSLLTGVPGPV
ncbi:MAG: hypothetical protein IJX37_06665 [Oscillospiraceae bacterium]|nr:hypothetical protein [Oscillospiraceae bacterium]